MFSQSCRCCSSFCRTFWRCFSFICWSRWASSSISRFALSSQSWSSSLRLRFSSSFLCLSCYICNSRSRMYFAWTDFFSCTSISFMFSSFSTPLRRKSSPLNPLSDSRPCCPPSPESPSLTCEGSSTCDRGARYSCGTWTTCSGALGLVCSWSLLYGYGLQARYWLQAAGGGSCFYSGSFLCSWLQKFCCQSLRWRASFCYSLRSIMGCIATGSIRRWLWMLEGQCPLRLAQFRAICYRSASPQRCRSSRFRSSMSIFIKNKSSEDDSYEAERGIFFAELTGDGGSSQTPVCKPFNLGRQSGHGQGIVGATATKHRRVPTSLGRCRRPICQFLDVSRRVADLGPKADLDSEEFALGVRPVQLSLVAYSPGADEGVAPEAHVEVESVVEGDDVAVRPVSKVQLELFFVAPPVYQVVVLEVLLPGDSPVHELLVGEQLLEGLLLPAAIIGAEGGVVWDVLLTHELLDGRTLVKTVVVGLVATQMDDRVGEQFSHFFYYLAHQLVGLVEGGVELSAVAAADQHRPAALAPSEGVRGGVDLGDHSDPAPQSLRLNLQDVLPRIYLSREGSFSCQFRHRSQVQRERVVVADVPVEHVEFVGRHNVDGLQYFFLREEVPAGVNHDRPPGKERSVFDQGGEVYFRGVGLLVEKLPESLQSPHQPWVKGSLEGPVFIREVE